MSGGRLRRPRLLTINFISKKSIKYIEKHVKNVKTHEKRIKMQIPQGGGIIKPHGSRTHSASNFVTMPDY